MVLQYKLWNCCSFSYGSSPHTISITLFGLEWIQFLQNWFQKTILHYLMMWLWHFSRSEIVIECRCSCYFWLHTWLWGSYTLRKGPLYSLQNDNDIGNEKEYHELRVSNWLDLSYGVILSYLIWGWRAHCLRAATRVCYDILRRERTSFEFERPASCVFNIGDVEWSITLEICALFAQQKVNNVRTMLAPIPFSPIITSNTVFRGNNMSICLIADTHSPK